MNPGQTHKLNELKQNLLSAFNMDGLNDCYGMLLDVLGEEEKYYKDIPSNAKESPRAKESERVIELLNRADDTLTDAVCLYVDYEFLFNGDKNDFRKKVTDTIDCIDEILRRYPKE